jgi:hypothetical protein
MSQSERAAPGGLRALLALLALAACAGNHSLDFPPGLDPVDPVNKAEFPAAVNGDPHPEALSMVSGESGYAWAHAKGYVKAPIADVYAAMRVPAVCVDRGRTDSWSLDPKYADPDYAYSFLIHASATNCFGICVTTDWDNTWRLGPYPWKSTENPPAAVAARWKMTFGTTYIDLMEGSIIARVVDAGTTSIEIEEHLDATQQGPSTVEQTEREYFSRLLLQVHGQPLP